MFSTLSHSNSSNAEDHKPYLRSITTVPIRLMRKMKHRDVLGKAEIWPRATQKTVRGPGLSKGWKPHKVNGSIACW